MRNNPCRVITGPEVRWSYAHVWDPQSFEGSEPKYSVSLLISKHDAETIRSISAAVRAAYVQGADRLQGSDSEVPLLSAIKSPVHDGDVERPENEEYHDCYFINANSPTAPGIVDASCRPITEQSQVYSGVYGRASISFYAYNVNGNRGIACRLNNLQKVRDGEPLGRLSAADEFGTVCDEFVR